MLMNNATNRGSMMMNGINTNNANANYAPNGLMHHPSTSNDSMLASTNRATINGIPNGTTSAYVLNQQQQQQQWQNMSTQSNQLYHQSHQMHNIPTQMIYRSNAQSNQQQQQPQQHLQQLPTNASMNGFPPSTSTSSNNMQGNENCINKKIVMKRKGSALLNDQSAMLNQQQQQSMVNMAQTDMHHGGPKKQAYIAVNSINQNLPSTITNSNSSMAFQQQNQLYQMQQSPKFSSNIAQQQQQQQQFSSQHFVSYEHHQMSATNMVNANTNNTTSGVSTDNMQGTQWINNANNNNGNNQLKRPNSNSELVRMELRNSVQARQNATSPNAIISNGTSNHQNENHFINGQSMMLSPSRLNSLSANQQQQQHLLKSTSNLAPANFIPLNSNNFVNNNKPINNNNADLQQQLQQQKGNITMSSINNNHSKQFLPQVSLEDCKNFMHHVDVDGIDLGMLVEIYDFKLLMNSSCGFDMDNVETQKLVQKMLS